LPKRLWPKVKMFGPLAAIAAVVMIVFITDLAMSPAMTPARPGRRVPLPPTEPLDRRTNVNADAYCCTDCIQHHRHTRDETRKADGRIRRRWRSTTTTGGNIAAACLPDSTPSATWRNTSILCRRTRGATRARTATGMRQTGGRTR
jgi:hypothetical protein